MLTLFYEIQFEGQFTLPSGDQKYNSISLLKVLNKVPMVGAYTWLEEKGLLPSQNQIPVLKAA